MKRAIDLTVASLALIATAPILLVASVAIVLTMGAPILFRDERAGRDGRPFQLLKFRTMRPLRPGESIPEHDGDRITRVGALLRSTSLDELPTLWNVLRGDLSVVGPRPLPVRYVDRYSPAQRRRLDVRPGVTGLAQVSGRNALGWDERFALDVDYVDNHSLGSDLAILGRTISSVLRREGISHDTDATMPEFHGPAA